jgi:cytochrome c-type biogenesis protein
MSGLPLPIAAFFAGLVAFLSPCVLPLVPGYVSLISGVGVQELQSHGSQSLRKVMRVTSVLENWKTQLQLRAQKWI